MPFTRFGPRHGIHNLKNDLDRLFEEFFGGESDTDLNRGDVSPKVSIEDKAGAYIAIFELPGLDKEAVKVTFQNNKLYITAEKKKENEESIYLKNERQFGKIARGLEFPLDIQSDKINATFENGLLIVTLPKAEKQSDPEIEVNIK